MAEARSMLICRCIRPRAGGAVQNARTGAESAEKPDAKIHPDCIIYEYIL